MEQFIVITSKDAKDFQSQVNEALQKGYTLHGITTYMATSHQDNWNNPDRTVSVRSWSENHYSQCMVLKD